MNYIITIIPNDSLSSLLKICRELKLTISLSTLCRGTAEKKLLDLLGIEDNEKRLVMTVASEENTKKYFKELKRKIHIGIPGRGVAISVPIKSVGGGKTVAYLNSDNTIEKKAPSINYNYELIVVISNEGHTDSVMQAARSAGARGGTVIHGKGTGAKETQKFYNLSIASEKEVILILSSADNKAEIMKSVLVNAGPDSKAGSVVFSLPVNDIAGFGTLDDND